MVINHAARSKALIPDTDRLLSLVVIQQDDLIQQNRAQCEQLAALQTFDRQLPRHSKMFLNEAVERLNGEQA